MSPVVKCTECGCPLKLDDNWEEEICRECDLPDYDFPRAEELNFDQD